MQNPSTLPLTAIKNPNLLRLHGLKVHRKRADRLSPRTPRQRLNRHWTDRNRDHKHLELRLQAHLAIQEDPDEVMADRSRKPKKLSKANRSSAIRKLLGLFDQTTHNNLGVPGYEPGCSWVMPKGFVQLTPRENVLDNQDSGDLTMGHLVRHTTWEAHDLDEEAEEERFESLYPHLAEAVAIERSRAHLPKERAPSDDSWVPGAIMAAAASRCRWHTHVRQVLPDSDELVHLGLPSDDDEFHGRALSGPALLW